MRKRMKGLVSSLLVLGLVLSMAMMSLTAKAADTSDGCEHKYFLISSTVNYPVADNQGHRKVVTKEYECTVCSHHMTVTEQTDEPHSINSVTHQCVCGFRPPYYFNIFRSYCGTFSGFF